jgi:hypothetical protein
MKCIIELQRPVFAIYLEENGSAMGGEPVVIRYAGINGDDEPCFFEVDQDTGEFFDPAQISNFGGYAFDRYPNPQELATRFPVQKGVLGKA